MRGVASRAALGEVGGTAVRQPLLVMRQLLLAVRQPLLVMRQLLLAVRKVRRQEL